MIFFTPITKRIMTSYDELVILCSARPKPGPKGVDPMNGITIQIAVRDAESLPAHHLLLSSALLKKKNIPVNQPILFQFGGYQQTVYAADAGISKGLHLSSVLANQTGLHTGARVRLKYHPSTRTLVVGPLIGVLINSVRQNNENRPFGTVTAFGRELTDAARQFGGLIYFFTPDDIKQDASTVTGWGYHHGWVQHTYPAPDVIYNRLTKRKLENKPSVQQFMKEVKSQYGTITFNERYVNKTEVFDSLRKEASLARYMPESHLFRGFHLLKSMMTRHATVFVKPITGSLGKGIIRIHRGPSGLECQFSSISGVKRQLYPSMARVFAAISPRLKKQQYQIQQGIPLLTVNDHPVDFRALVQKNIKGVWILTSIVARIAGTNHFVSNLARGGTLSSVSDALLRSNLNPSQRKAVRGQLRRAAKEIARGIETNIGSHFGELGIDLAVDQRGKVWLIEVNSKPSKNENSALTPGRTRPSVKQFILYCRYLAKL